MIEINDKIYEIKRNYAEYVEREFGDEINLDEIDVTKPLDLAYTEDDYGTPIESKLYVTNREIITKVDGEISEIIGYDTYEALILELKYLTFDDLVGEYVV